MNHRGDEMNIDAALERAMWTSHRKWAEERRQFCGIPKDDPQTETLGIDVYRSAFRAGACWAQIEAQDPLSFITSLGKKESEMTSFEYQILLKGERTAQPRSASEMTAEPNGLLVDTTTVMAKDLAEAKMLALAAFFRDPENTDVDATRVEVLVRPFCH